MTSFVNFCVHVLWTWLPWTYILYIKLIGVVINFLGQPDILIFYYFLMMRLWLCTKFSHLVRWWKWHNLVRGFLIQPISVWVYNWWWLQVLDVFFIFLFLQNIFIGSTRMSLLSCLYWIWFESLSIALRTLIAVPIHTTRLYKIYIPIGIGGKYWVISGRKF